MELINYSLYSNSNQINSICCFSKIKSNNFFRWTKHKKIHDYLFIMRIYFFSISFLTLFYMHYIYTFFFICVTFCKYILSRLFCILILVKLSRISFIHIPLYFIDNSFLMIFILVLTINLNFRLIFALIFL